MKKKDLFKNCCSPGYWIIFIPLIAAVLSPQPYQNYLFVLFFFVVGGACLLNFNRCGRVHCQITGWGFLAVGIFALLKVLNIFNISWNTLWTIFWIVLIIGFAVELINWRKAGSCYVKRK